MIEREHQAPEELLMRRDIPPVEHQRILRDYWSDEIPTDILHGPVNSSDPKRFKVRRNWWQGVVDGLTGLQKRGLVPHGLEEEVADFMTHYTSDEFHNQQLTTAEDIQRANTLITKIVGDK
jgi:hypothetical protein